MDEFISRKAAIAYIREQLEECQKAFEELGGESGIYADAYNDLAEDFYSIPAADVAPVTRCKGCKYFDKAAPNDKGFCICPASGMEIVAELTYSVAEKNTLRNDVTKTVDRAAFECGRADYAEAHPWRNLWAWMKRKAKTA